MKIADLNRMDGLSLDLDAPCDPFADGGIGLEPFLEAIETHAGDWMPTIVHGRRDRKYTRTAFDKACAEARDWLGLSVYLKRPPSPDVSLSVHIGRHPGPMQLRFSLDLLPFAFFQEPAQAAERSRRLVELVRAWASHYPPTHATAHSRADLEISGYWSWVDPQQLSRQPTLQERASSVHWLNVFGREMVDMLGRERVLSTPAHLVEELPTGAVLLVLRPTVADFASEEARQAQARALVHLRPERDFDTVLRELRGHSAALAPVEPRFDPDVASLWVRALDTFTISERQRQIAEWNQRHVPEVDEWLPAKAAPLSDVANEKAALEQYAELAEDLVVLLHAEVPSIFQETLEALTGIDLHLWFERFPTRYERELLDTRIVPAVGAYLGQVLVSQLDGRWVPRRNLDEAQVVIGDRAWLPFVRARRYLQSRQALLDHSLTKLYREAERHR